jgi:hypothetical protein
MARAGGVEAMAAARALRPGDQRRRGFVNCSCTSSLRRLLFAPSLARPFEPWWVDPVLRGARLAVEIFVVVWVSIASFRLVEYVIDTKGAGGDLHPVAGAGHGALRSPGNFSLDGIGRSVDGLLDGYAVRLCAKQAREEDWRGNVTVGDLERCKAKVVNWVSRLLTYVEDHNRAVGHMYLNPPQASADDPRLLTYEPAHGYGNVIQQVVTSFLLAIESNRTVRHQLVSLPARTAVILRGRSH